MFIYPYLLIFVKNLLLDYAYADFNNNKLYRPK